MRVIHGIWAHGALCLWAEDPDLPPASAAPHDVRLPRPHPFACQAAELADMLAGRPGLGRRRSATRPARPSRRADPAAAVAGRRAAGLAGTGASRVSRVSRAPGAGPARRGPGIGCRWPAGGCRSLAFGPAAALAVLAGFAGSDERPPRPGRWPYLTVAGRLRRRPGRRAAGCCPCWPTRVGLRRPVAPGARRRGRAARARPGRGDAAVLPGGRGASSGAVAGRARWMRWPTPRRGPGCPARCCPPRRGRTPARIPLAERYVLALTSTDACLEVATPQDEAFWARAGRAGRGTGRVAGTARRIPAGPGPDLLPAGRARRPGYWSLAGRVRAAVRRRPEPDDLRRRRLGRARGRLPGAAGARGDPVEELLAGLGAAARLFGELEDALREAAPARVELDTPGAFRFLNETAPLLAGAGFGVLLPDWVRKARLGLKLTTRSQSPVGHVGHRAEVRPGRPGGLPVRPGRRRRGARPGRAGRAGPAQGPAGPAARPVGRAGRRAPEGGAEVPRAQPGRDDDRRRRAGGRPARPGLRRPAGRRGRRRLAGRPAVRAGRPAAAAHDDARGLLRPAAPLPGTRALLAVLPRRARPRRHPGRRHGPGQDDPAAVAHLGPAPRIRPHVAGVPDVAGRQLAARGGAVHPGPAGACAPRRGPAGRRVARFGRWPAWTWSSPPTASPPGTRPR